MKLFNSSRFRLRTMLFAIAVVAVAAYVTREWMLLRDARQQHDYDRLSWDVGRVTAENVALSSARLMEREAAAPWISDRAAQQLHVDRLARLLDEIEAGTELQPDFVERQTEFVRREIEKYGGDAGSDP